MDQTCVAPSNSSFISSVHHSSWVTIAHGVGWPLIYGGTLVAWHHRWVFGNPIIQRDCNSLSLIDVARQRVFLLELKLCTWRINFMLEIPGLQLNQTQVPFEEQFTKQLFSLWASLPRTKFKKQHKMKLKGSGLYFLEKTFQLGKSYIKIFFLCWHLEEVLFYIIQQSLFYWQWYNTIIIY